MNLDKIMRGLWIVLATIQIASLPAQGQSDANTSQAQTSGIAIKLFDPNPHAPNQMLTQDINNVGEIVGYLGNEHNGHGFLRSNRGQYTEFFFPGTCFFSDQPCSYPTGVNDRGEIIGTTRFAIEPQAFLREKDGSVTTLPASPGNSVPSPVSINNQGEIVGTYSRSNESGMHGFLLRGGEYTTIDFPGTASIVCTAINNSGLVTGFYYENGAPHGFLWLRGNFIATFQVFESGSARATTPQAINDAGQVVGGYASSVRAGATFVRNLDGTIKIIDLGALLQPIGGSGGIVTGINNQGDLVGHFGSGAGFSPIFGFLIPRGAGTPR